MSMIADRLEEYRKAHHPLCPPVFAYLCKRRRENPSLKRPESLVAPEQKCLGR